MKRTKNILSKVFSNGKLQTKELFYLAYHDGGGKFFESAYRPKDIEQGFELHHLFCPNSFYRKPRAKENLHTLYAIWVDLDGIRVPFPICYLDILERWRELGFSIPPSLIISTSPGHFHIILFLKPMRAFPEKIAFWELCQRGLCQLLKEFHADYQPPTGFIRIPGHLNFKHPEKPLVEIVFQSDSTFTLSEIHEILIENGIARKKEKGNASVEEKIKIILENGVAHGARERAAFTLAIFFIL